ncbi:hypothetical protein VTK56DRAFT_10006 [Thermocarpiscus australiensis]
MVETQRRPGESSTPKAVKNKKCPYCNQAFTSSSLGRHLDLFIRETNPKAPDGVHDVEAIRKIRENITRRHPRGAVVRRTTSTSVWSLTTAERRTPASGDAESPAGSSSPFQVADGHQVGCGTARKQPLSTPTGVSGPGARERGVEALRDGEGDGANTSSRPMPSQRTVSRQMRKQHLETRQRIQDALDTSRAAELALRELLGSLRAAKSVSQPHRDPDPDRSRYYAVD